MFELQGKYSTAKIFTDNMEETAQAQTLKLLNQPTFKDTKVRIMPDTHAGKGCVIGFTADIKDKVIPNLVGVDIGCGILAVNLGNIEIDFEQLDNYIRNNIPSGHNVNLNPKVDYKDEIEKLICFREIPKSSREFNRAIGSLGGGNHFIEVNEDKTGNKYLVIHSGSRNLGHQVASYYQKRAYDYHNGMNDEYMKAQEQLIIDYKTQGKRKEIQTALKELKQSFKRESKIPKDLCYLEGQLKDEYLHDMGIAQEYAYLNREIMAQRIVYECLGINYSELEKFQTIHNYIDLESNIIRKGAISAKKGEKVIIPINMRDGSIIAIGKGNEDWNNSAPHGAGRLMSRSKAKEDLSLDDYKNTMNSVWSTSVKESTLDEAPMAYKPIEEILNNIDDTVEVIDVIRPLYNFKA